jgi:mono/diheme cytochrome c family protein
MPSSRKWMVAICVLILMSNARIARADDVAQGRAIYLHYCASCHGPKGEGNGPVARALKTPPTNLRLLSDLYGNPLQEDKVARAIDGRAEVEAHGPREMPVWGEHFSYENQGDERKVKERIGKLVAYLQSLQTGARSASLK